MAEHSVPTGSNGRLILAANEVGYDAGGNWSDVSWAMWLEEASSSPTTWTGGGVSAQVGHFGIGPWWSGSFGFDWRPGGLQLQLLASGTNRVNHQPDGTGSVTVEGAMGATGTSGAGGPTSLQVTVGLTTLKVAPNTPSGLTATYISDTQVQLAWTNSGASNGQPDTNDIEVFINGVVQPQLTISAANGATVSAIPNRKYTYRVRAWNAGGGHSGWTGQTSPVYTTPAAPSNVTAIKDASGNIDISFTENVDYSEHTHEVWHGTVSGGVTTWDGSALTNLASGVTVYEHASPNAGQQHKYRVRAKAGSLSSAWVESATVVLLAAPAKPTIPALAAFADKASVFRFPWIHNTIDSSAQTKYQWRWSTNGGSNWTTGAKTSSVNQYHDFAANTWTANQTVTFQVRTKGAYDSGSDGDASYSPWSNSVAVTFKTIPTTTITAPANGGSLSDSTVRVNLSFSQAESATFVKAQLELLQGATLLSAIETTNLVGSTFPYAAQNGVSYTVRARSQDSNGLWSAWVSNTFSVAYLSPPAPLVSATYIDVNGFAQINVTVPAPGGGQSAATLVGIARTIDGVTEEIVTNYPASPTLVFLDTLPTIHGVNTYTVWTITALGATAVTVVHLTTEECRRAFLSKGAGFDNVTVFGGNLQVDESVGVASATITAAGRTKPIGLYGVETSLQLKVKSRIIPDFGSTLDDLRAILLVPGKACFRDATGRRIFGSVKGQVSYEKVDRGDFSFTMTETS